MDYIYSWFWPTTTSCPPPPPPPPVYDTKTVLLKGNSKSCNNFKSLDFQINESDIKDVIASLKKINSSYNQIKDFTVQDGVLGEINKLKTD